VGAFFGEIAALGRSPRTATIFAETPSELLEIRWQGLRDIRRRTPAIKQHIEELYRQNSLGSQLRATSLFAHLSQANLARVAEQTSFETYGEFDWYASYRNLAEKAESREREPVIAEAGQYANGLILIRSGFARLSEPYCDSERTVDYLGKGRAFGLEEITTNWREGSSRPLRRSLSAVGYVDILTVPTSILEELVLPTAPVAALPSLDTTGDESPPLAQSLLEFLADNRYINGTATMMIDLERCVRCDDCVTACATTHDGNPRFIRHGSRHGRFMVANACMHCVDPVCMIGCPTGAIHRSQSAGQVLINDRTCVGCMTCAESCPYDNIRMVEVRNRRGMILLDESTQQPILKATKCDLCIEQPAGPACQQACPHDALRRVDMQNLAPVARWMGRR
jgi:Fe-S-cluster-containing dehydrogenase component